MTCQRCISNLLILFSLVFGGQAWAWKLESAVITLPSTQASPNFITVNFRQSYDVTPLVFALATNEGGDPCAIRIRNVSLTSFDIIHVEPNANDGRHIAMNNVTYIAVEPGVHALPDGTRLAAIAHSTASVQHGNGVVGVEAWDTVNWGMTFASNPSVLGHIQTMANESSTPPATSSIPWLTTALRNVGTMSVQTALERSESGSGTVGVNETIGILAVGAGAGSFDDNNDQSIDFQALISADHITGNCVTTNFGITYAATPLLVASANRHDGGDGGWLRRCSINTSSVSLQVEEDIDNDGERNHTTESAGMVIFSQAFDANIIPDLWVEKTVATISDPVNATNPKAIPGAFMQYSVEIINRGLGRANAGSLWVTDPIPSNTALFVGDLGGAGSGPVAFVDPSSSSGLTYTFGDLSDLTDDVEFSNDNGATFIYQPTADANGVDDQVTHIRIRPGTFTSDQLLGRNGGANPSFQVRFRVLLQ